MWKRFSWFRKSRAELTKPGKPEPVIPFSLELSSNARSFCLLYSRLTETQRKDLLFYGHFEVATKYGKFLVILRHSLPVFSLDSKCFYCVQQRLHLYPHHGLFDPVSLFDLMLMWKVYLEANPKQLLQVAVKNHSCVDSSPAGEWLKVARDYYSHLKKYTGEGLNVLKD